MIGHSYQERVENLMDPAANVFLGSDEQAARAALADGDVEALGRVSGQFALLHRDGRIVRMARSIGRPMRYFLAKRAEGPCLVVAERMDEIRDFLNAEGLGDQFHPSYTRMVPAHYMVELELLGCPDPNPDYRRFFEPVRNRWSTDLDEIGRRYISALAEVCDRWLDTIPKDEPIGVLFSGGIDSGAVFLTIRHLLEARGDAPTRLKAFTLRVQGGKDADQALDFLSQLGHSIYLEVVDVATEDLNYADAVRVIEDYKPLDVQAATAGLALCREIRNRYPDWRYLIDGDGGDENLKDYPIEENPELTIRSVLNNLMLYQEGWGVHAIKHSLTYSGGQSRGHVRSWAPARHLGFSGFSPFAVTEVIAVAEGIPFIELTDWDHERLYALKGEVVARGIRQLTGEAMPVYEKRRFQRGVVDDSTFEDVFPESEMPYRIAFAEAYS
ncbi:MAG: asparagine synthetase B family protein [Rhodothermales bacterium]|nr:asparagine synthetase B family protein [Rhodothermales bacterium]